MTTDSLSLGGSDDHLEQVGRDGAGFDLVGEIPGKGEHGERGRTLESDHEWARMNTNLLTQQAPQDS